MRTIPVSQIRDAVKEMCIEANLFLTKDMEAALKRAREEEEAPLGQSVLDQLEEKFRATFRRIRCTALSTALGDRPTLRAISPQESPLK